MAHGIAHILSAKWLLASRESFRIRVKARVNSRAERRLGLELHVHVVALHQYQDAG